MSTQKLETDLKRQESINEQRRQKRQHARHLKFTTPREGAREEIVGNIVSGIITRLLKRKRNNDSRRAKGSNPKAVQRVAEWHDKKKKEAAARGITKDRLLQERKEAYAKKPKTYSNPQDRHRERVRTDEAYKITTNLRTRLGEFLRLKNGTKAHGTMELVGCSQKELIEHLNSQLLDNERLLDYSIDHVFPMTMYDAQDAHQQRQMMHYTNLQPMKLYGQGGNISKNNKMPSFTEASKVARWAWPPGVDESFFT